MFVYEIGQEGRIVVEKAHYGSSIFSSQYRKALDRIDFYLGDSTPDTSRIVCFCGERGVGKTSCMMSVRDLISKAKRLSTADGLKPTELVDAEYLESIGIRNYKAKRVYCPEIIDPSFFDTSHNLLEILIGRLYASLKAEVKPKMASIDRNALHELYRSFEDVKRAIYYLHKDSKESYSNLTDLDMLASSVMLKNQIRTLFNKFLSFIGAEVMILTIDDIDLCPQGAYEMCEQIRKYLAMPECIVLMSVKFEQLEDVLASRFAEERKMKFPKENSEFMNMARRYLTKLLPVSVRVNMPSVFDICNQPLRVKMTENGITKFLEQYSSIRSAIPEMIFRKTRYLFYNNKGGISPIVPDNLRQFVALLGLLCSLEDINDDADDRLEVLLRNDSVFKQFFYKVWADELPVDYKRVIEEWTQNTSYEALNKSVVTWLSEHFSDELGRTYSDGGELKTEITRRDNFSYNVSLGDVFYILSLLEMDNQEAFKSKMLFFIRSMYSIALFESYDVDIFAIEHNSENKDDNEAGLYRFDQRFDKTLQLQRLIWGSYFTFVPGELLPTDSSGYFHWDTRIINGSAKNPDVVIDSLTELLKECKEIMDDIVSLENTKKGLSPAEAQAVEEENKAYIDWRKKQFRMAEFFILTISRSISSKEIDSFYRDADAFRAISTPAYFSEFNPQTGYYVFNALTPFYSLINPRYAYSRFERITGQDMYEFALNHDFSLLSEIIAECKQSRLHINSETEQGRLHCLMSDVVIRNGEVLDAIRENTKSRRFENHSETGVNKIINLYKKISSSGMRTHQKSANGDDRHDIDFRFLNPLIKFLNSLAAQGNEDLKEYFEEIFDSVEKVRYERWNGSKNKSGSSAQTDNEDYKKRMKLFGSIEELFPNSFRGDYRTVYNTLSGKFKERIESLHLTPGSLLQGKQNNAIIIYDNRKIIDFLSSPGNEARLDNWLNLFSL